MRELAKSIGSLSLALPMFGANQMLKLITAPPAERKDHPATEGNHGVTGAAEQHLDGYFRVVFQAGDRVQRSAVDLAFGVASGEALDPNKLMKLSTTMLLTTTEAMGQMIPGSTTSSQPQGAGTGWGPMPDCE